MNIIHQSVLDKEQWDQLVMRYDATAFSMSWYLDACAQDWCVLVDETFENGIALPFSHKLGIKALTPPIFVRNLDFIGTSEIFRKQALKHIRGTFPIGHLQMMPQLTEEQPSRTRLFQTIEAPVEIHKHAKRMISKAMKNEISVAFTDDWQTIYSIIASELTLKISEFNAPNLSRLKFLIASAAAQQQLIAKGIFHNGKLEGGMLFIDSKNTHVYLKGAANPEVKKNGGMYLCMHTCIDEALEAGKTFDFGGSEVEGVRKFNTNLGGADREYHTYEWNNAPFWYNTVRWLYQKVQKN